MRSLIVGERGKKKKKKNLSKNYFIFCCNRYQNNENQQHNSNSHFRTKEKVELIYSLFTRTINNQRYSIRSNWLQHRYVCIQIRQTELRNFHGKARRTIEISWQNKMQQPQFFSRKLSVPPPNYYHLQIKHTNSNNDVIIMILSMLHSMDYIE